jgi:hypothetical protein
VTDQRNEASAGRWKAFLGTLGRIVLAAVLVGGAVAAAQVAVKLLRGVLSFGGAVPAFYYLAYLVASVLAAYLVYRAYVCLVEKRAATELSGAGAFVEEIVVRGVVFRITEERLGTWAALAVSVVLFALLHLAGPGATVTSTVVVGAEGGVLLSAAYVLTRRLWLPNGIHFG